MGDPALTSSSRPSTLIEGALLLDANRPSAERADLRIADGRIAAIGRHLAPEPGENLIDANGKLLTPGLVNAHLHSSEALVRGRYENLPLEIWALYAYPMSPSPELTSDLIYLRTMLVALESLKNGVTTVVDDGPETAMLDLDVLAAVFAAYRDIGLRANCSGAVVNRHMLEALPHTDEFPSELRDAFTAASLPGPESYIEFSEEAIRRFHGSHNDRLRYLIAPVAPQWCTDDMLRAAAELSARHEINFHTHVLETRTQLETSKAIYGQSLLSYMADLGLLTELTTIAHSIWISESDLDLIAGAGASVVHNPISNQKLGAGVAPLRALLDAGVNVGLGTDGIASNDSARLFDVMRSAALIHNVTTSDYSRWPTAAEVWRAATIGGARSVRLGDDIGQLEVGQKADLVLLDLDTLAFTPRHDPIKHLVYCENGSSISMVFVDGRPVVENGRVLTVDEAGIIAAVNELFPSFSRQQEAAEESQRRFDAPLASIVRRSADSGQIRLLP